MGNSIGSITADLVLNDKQFNDGLNQATENFQKSSKAMMASAAAISAAVIGVGAAMVKMALDTARARDEITKSARTAGVTTKEFSALKFAADRSGISIEQLSKNLSRLSTDRATKAFQQLGIATADVNGKAKSNTELLSDLADKIKNTESPAQKASIAMSVFGEEGAKMVNMLDNGSAGLEELTKKAEELGLVFEDGSAYEQFNDSLDTLWDSVDGLKMSIGSMVVDFINSTGILETLTDVVSGVTQWFNNLSQTSKDMIAGITAIALGVGALIAGFLVVQTIGPAVGAAMTAAFGPVGVVIMAVVGAVAALVAVGVLLVQNWERFGAAVEPIEDAFQTLKTVFSDIWSSIKEAIPMLDELFSGDKGKGFIDYLLDGLLVIIKVISSVVVMVQELVNTLPPIFEQIGYLMDAIGFRIQAAVTFGPRGEELKQIANEGIEMAISNMEMLADDAMSRLEPQFEKIWSASIGPAKDAGKESANEYSNEASKELNKSGVEKEAYKVQHNVSKILGEMGVEVSKTMDQSFQAVEQFMREGMKSFSEYARAMADAAMQKIQDTRELTGWLGDVFARQAQKEHEREIEALEEKEQKKLEIIRQAKIDELALNDEAFRKQKERLDEEFAQKVAQKEREKELKIQEHEEATESHFEEQLAKAIINDDFAKWKEAAQQEHYKNLLNLEQGKEKKDTEIQERANQKETELALKKEEKLQKMKDEKAKADTERKKKVAFIQWVMDYQGFMIEKKMAKMQATMQFAQTMMSAVQAMATIMATIPIAGLVLGPTMFAMIAGLGAATYNTTMGMIQSQMPPLPPAELMAEKGGLLMGPSHVNGGIDVNAQGGEFIMNREATRRNLPELMRMNAGKESMPAGNVTVIFQEGAIGSVDSTDRVQEISQAIAQGVQNRRALAYS